MFKKFMLTAFVSTLALSSAQASNVHNDNNNSNNNQPAFLAEQAATQQQQQYRSAAIQLNLDTEASRDVFAFAADLSTQLPEGMTPLMGTNTPHVTLETFETITQNNNLSADQLSILKEKLNALSVMGAHVVPVELLLIAKITGQTNQYFTAANINELNYKTGDLTECILTYSCNIILDGKVIDGKRFMKDLQPLLHEGLAKAGLKPGPFPDPLCHITLMNMMTSTVVAMSVQLFDENNGIKKSFALDKLVLNPAFANNKVQTPNFDVQQKLTWRAKADWGQAPRAFVSLSMKEAPSAERTSLADKIESTKADLARQKYYLSMTQNNIKKGTSGLQEKEKNQIAQVEYLTAQMAKLTTQQAAVPTVSPKRNATTTQPAAAPAAEEKLRETREEFIDHLLTASINKNDAIRKNQAYIDMTQGGIDRINRYLNDPHCPSDTKESLTGELTGKNDIMKKLNATNSKLKAELKDIDSKLQKAL
jgi:hypothetical protein